MLILSNNPNQQQSFNQRRLPCSWQLSQVACSRTYSGW